MSLLEPHPALVRAHAAALEQLKQQLDAHNVAFLNEHLAREVDDELRALYMQDLFLGIALPQYDLARYADHRDQDGRVKYDRRALSALLGRVIARLRGVLDQVSLPPGTSTLDFSFIRSERIRAIVERDFKELQRASVANCAKAKLVLAGGCIEGILYDLVERDLTRALSAKAKPKDDDPSRWTLGQLVSVSTELQLIPPGVDKLAGGIKDYRNLVHPAVEVRENLSPGEPEAEIAVRILEMLHRDLSGPAA